MSAREFLSLPNEQPIIMTKADVLALANEIARAQRDRRMLTLKEAAAAYNMDERTIKARVIAGLIDGRKEGGTWAVESPAARMERLHNH